MNDAGRKYTHPVYLWQPSQTPLARMTNPISQVEQRNEAHTARICSTTPPPTSHSSANFLHQENPQ